MILNIINSENSKHHIAQLRTTTKKLNFQPIPVLN